MLEFEHPHRRRNVVCEERPLLSHPGDRPSEVLGDTGHPQSLSGGTAERNVGSGGRMPRSSLARFDRLDPVLSQCLDVGSDAWIQSGVRGGRHDGGGRAS